MTDAPPKPWAVIDVETSCVKTKAGEWASLPWATDELGVSPRSLLIGMKPVRVEGDKAFIETIPFIFAAVAEMDTALHMLSEYATLIGHNIKFDAAHVDGINSHTVWDTMIAEYILTAQVTKFAKLEELRAKYASAMPMKLDLIGSNLAKGVPPQDIPDAELRPYLQSDLHITAAVFKCQWELATPRQRALILVQSTASLAYGEIEDNGLTLDVPYTIAQRDHHANEMQAAREAFAHRFSMATGKDDDQLNLLRFDSLFTPSILSTVFFGSPPTIEGKVELTPEEKIGLPKNRRFKLVKINAVGPAYGPALDPSAYGAASMKVSPSIFKIDDDILAKIEGEGKSYYSLMAGLVRDYRKHQKIHGTYLDAWLTEIEKYYDRKLHPKVHSTSTDTGRTSSSGPNVQNIPDEGRMCVTTRYDAGYLLEADFKQLEVCGLAEVSGCGALIGALKAGTDIHYESGRSVYGWKFPAEMTKDLRRIVKTINFGLIYGGSAKTLAEQAGVDVETAQDLIKSFYTRFPGVKLWQDSMIRRVTERPDDIVISEGPHGTLTSHVIATPTGRNYSFPLEPPPPWMPPPMAKKRGNSPSPTKIKNYPVQGFATGDIVPLAVMLFWKELQARGLADECLLCNVVHDSILVDCINSFKAAEAQAALDHVVTIKLPAALKSLWGIELNVPLAVDVSLLKHWKNRST